MSVVHLALLASACPACISLPVPGPVPERWLPACVRACGCVALALMRARMDCSTIYVLYIYIYIATVNYD